MTVLSEKARYTLLAWGTKRRVSKDQYFGEVSGYDFRKVACKDAEIYDMMMSQNQYKAISEAEFLERFLLNQSKKEQFLEETISNHNLRGIIFWELTKHMQIEGEKVTIL